MQKVLTRVPVKVLQPSGYINASNAVDFQSELAAIIANHQYSVVLVDLSQVESLDSAGLVTLVSALTLSQQSNKRFSLCGVSSSIRIIFELTQMDQVFEIFESQAAFLGELV